MCRTLETKKARKDCFKLVATNFKRDLGPLRGWRVSRRRR
jgi:hypothetical protein